MNNALYALLPAMTQEAQNKLTKEERNQLFLRAILRDQFASSGNRSLASFISTKDSVDKEIELVTTRAELASANRRIQELETDASKESESAPSKSGNGDQGKDVDLLREASKALVQLINFIQDAKGSDQAALKKKMAELNAEAKASAVARLIDTKAR